MSVETATYIDQLVPANPAGSDVVADGATHLRLVKGVLQNQFPSLGNNPVSATALQLNQFVPIGCAMLWTQSIASIPSNWALAMGQTVAKSDGSGNITLPDLRGIFPFGASQDSGGAAGTNVGDSGGASSNTPTITVAGHTLSLSEIPTHSHSAVDSGHSHTINDGGHSHTYQETVTTASTAGTSIPILAVSTLSAQSTSVSTTGITGANQGFANISIGNNGSGGAHNHTASSSAVSTIPPFKAYAWIVRV